MLVVVLSSLFAAALAAPNANDAPSRLPLLRKRHVAGSMVTRVPRIFLSAAALGGGEDPRRNPSHGIHGSHDISTAGSRAHVSHVSRRVPGYVASSQSGEMSSARVDGEKEGGGDAHEWVWRGNKIAWKEAGPKDGPCVVLIHGFGVSSSQYRDNLPALAAKGYRTFALDLLGLGSSEKPVIDYSIEMWADQVSDFVQEVVGRPSVLVGNSIGSLIGLAVAQPSRIEKYAFPLVNGLVLINCAIGMNSKIKEDPSIPPWQFFILSSLFGLVDFVLNSPVAKPLFNSLRGQENIRNLLTNLYANPARVDDYLVREVVTAANDVGAFEVFVKILTGDPGTRPEVLMEDVMVPTYVLWGDNDPVTPINGPVGKYFKGLSEGGDLGSSVNSNGRNPQSTTTFETLPGAGHCPHDDDPAVINGKIAAWLDTLLR